MSDGGWMRPGDRRPGGGRPDDPGGRPPSGRPPGAPRPDDPRRRPGPPPDRAGQPPGRGGQQPRRGGPPPDGASQGPRRPPRDPAEGPPRRGAPGGRRPGPPPEHVTEPIPAVRGRRGNGGAADAPSTRRGRRPQDGEGDERERGERGERARGERKRRRRRNRRVLIVLAVIALPFLLGLGWFAYQLRPGSEGPRVAVVVIEEGWGSGDIGGVLAQKGVIGSKIAFQVWATITRAGPFRAGCYTNLRQDIGIRSAMSTLESTEPGTWVTKDKECVPSTSGEDIELLLRPGLTVTQIAAEVAKLPGRSAEKFIEVAQSGTIRSKYQPAEITSLEGLLFPDTYSIGANEDEAAIIRRLVERFDQIADAAGLGTATRVTPYQTVIAASLIETEAGVAEDQPLIAAVIYNRLRDGVQLQIDSTLCFAKGGCPPSPTDADKALDSPYNTYKIAGLPPTPISSVTEASLKAALAPADVPFKFYVLADANGKHVFATTLEEHDRNVEEARAKGLL